MQHRTRSAILACTVLAAVYVLGLGTQLLGAQRSHRGDGATRRGASSPSWNVVAAMPPEAWVVYAQLAPGRVWPELVRRASVTSFHDPSFVEAVEAVAWGPNAVGTREEKEARAWLLAHAERSPDYMWHYLLAEAETDPDRPPRVTCNGSVTVATVRCERAHGEHHGAKGGHVLAVEAFQRAHRICVALPPCTVCDRVFFGLGVAFDRMGWAVKAHAILSQCLQRAQQAEDVALESLCANGLGESLLHEGDVRLGIQYLNRSLAIESFRGVCRSLTQVAGRIADIYLNYEKCNDAEPYLAIVETRGLECNQWFESWRARLHIAKCRCLRGTKEDSASILSLVDKDVLTHNQQVEGFTAVAQVMEHFDMPEAALRYYYDARTASSYLELPQVTQMLSSKVLQLVFRLKAPDSTLQREIAKAISDWKRVS